MKSVIATIIDQLNEVFSEMDARVLEESKKWAIARRDAVYDFKTSDEFKILKAKSTFLAYEKCFEIAGGKTWYNNLHGRGDEDILKFVEKNCKAIADRRNNSIAKKLEKAQVTEIISNEFNRTHDGFNGFYVINTNTGEKRVRIETIYAGGYNIQCLHLRVLVNVK